MQSVNLSATIGISEAVSICTSSRVGRIIPSVPIAGIHRESKICSVVHNQMQGHNAVATRRIGQGERSIVSALRIG